MNKKLIITAGSAYTDIDVFACALAYSELQKTLGNESSVVLPGPLNETISQTLKNFKVEYKTTLENRDECEFVLVDISDPKYAASFVDQTKVKYIFDHHPGFESYWHEKIGDKAIIQPVGSCATLIWEEYKKAGIQDKISHESALLLYTAIISNTLHQQAAITTDRDRGALKEIHHHITIPEGWIANYYAEITASIINYPEAAMRNDTKITEINGKMFGIIQIELWDSELFIRKNHELIVRTLKAINADHTFLTTPSISQEHNYLVTEDDAVKKLLNEKLEATFIGDIGKTKKLWLRKEIMKALSS
ncbi:MAG: hypothetical protein M3Q44_00505 [bacterium]|nr:hypothetical protein [bacterium]